MSKRSWMPTLGQEFIDDTHVADPLAIADGLFRRLLDAGVPLLRANITLSTLHPVIMGMSYRWTRQGDKTVVVQGRRAVIERDVYKQSPYKLIYEDHVAGIRRRLELPTELNDLALLDEMRAMGATDYVAMAMSAGLIGGVIGTWTTDRRGGFTTPELVLVEGELRAAAMAIENTNLRKIAVHLLDTYLGPRAGSRVLTGEISRGSGETLEAVIWLVDMRGFTTLSDTLPRDELIALLNEYYDAVIEPVQAHGGEVIKFMGDGVLAIFPTDSDIGPKTVCDESLAAADEALAALARRNAEAAADAPKIEIGVVMHMGDVSFGNVGAADRLDFTVIGPAVNLASRFERLCSELGEPVLMSEAVARHLPNRTEQISEQNFRGLAQSYKVYRPRRRS